jgi:hypothetical protein
MDADDARVIATLHIRYEASAPVLTWLKRQAPRWTFETRADPPGSHIRLITVFAPAGKVVILERTVFHNALRAAFPKPRPWLGWEEEELS